MTSIDFDFTRYVEEQKDPVKATANYGYAFTGDQKVLRTLAYLKPVNVAIEAVVRFWKHFGKNDLMGSAVKVGPNQFPRLHEMVLECAKTLQIPPPAVYIAQAIGYLNAHTYGTNEDSFIMINSATVDHLSDKELLFVIGHECGHIQNGHVVYHTVAYYLTHMASLVVRWVASPALLALKSWSRRAEVTADRAGLICCRNLDVATSALVKFALGSVKLYEEINIDEYLVQLKEVKVGLGRIAELNQSHPYLPKRVESLRLFANSLYFRSRILGQQDGLDLEELDRKVEEIIQILT